MLVAFVQSLQSKLPTHSATHLGRQLHRGWWLVRPHTQNSLVEGVCCPCRLVEQQPRMTSSQPTSAHAGAVVAATHMRAQKKAKSRQSSTAAAAAAAAVVCTTQPSSSSDGSEQHAALFRPPSRASSPATGSIKSAKRKAAEALLAAQYAGHTAGSRMGGSLFAAAPTPAGTALTPQGPHRGFTSHAHAAAGAADVGDAASDASAQQCVGYEGKRQRVALAAAILRLGDGPSAAAATWEAGESPATAQQQQQPVGAQLLQSQDTAQQQQKRQQQQRRPLGSSSSTGQPSQNGATAGGAAGAVMAEGSQAAAQAVSVEAAGAAAQQQQQQGNARGGQPPPVLVPACDPECSHHLSQGWCHTQVRLPHVDWGRVLDADMSKTPSFRMAEGYERLHMPAGIQVLVVEHVQHIPAALVQLRCSMQDPIVAIDLEWRPEFGRGFTPVALVQLASSRLAVLIRTCKMGYRLPQPLRDFMVDPQVHLLGFSWATSDEGKMRSTFGVGSKDFGRFLDLQQVAHGLGYNQFGLARLTQQVLGLHMPKNKKVSMSNWEGIRLTQSQVKYAALDVLMAGQVFRALRLWHSSPSPCEVCQHTIGAPTNVSQYTCVSCNKTFFNIRTYLAHCERMRHTAAYTECEGCGCARPLALPPDRATAEAAAAAAAVAAAAPVEQQQQ